MKKILYIVLLSVATCLAQGSNIKYTLQNRFTIGSDSTAKGGVGMTPLDSLPYSWTLPNGGTMGSKTFISGWQAGNGWQIAYDSSEYNLTIDNLILRGTLRAYELMINQIRAVNGNMLISDAAKVDSARTDSTFIIFDDPAGNGLAPFVANDMIMCQVVDIRGVTFDGSGDVNNDSYLIKRLIYKVDSVSGVKVYYSVLIGAPTNKSYPKVGDTFVRFGNTSNSSRQGAIGFYSNDEYSPYIRITDGVNSWSAWKSLTATVGQFGRLDGLSTAIGGLSGYGIYSQRFYFVKDANNYMSYNGTDFKLKIGGHNLDSTANSLDSAWTSIDANDSLIALKANRTYVDSQITSVSAAITTETGNRESEDNSLWSAVNLKATAANLDTLATYADSAVANIRVEAGSSYSSLYSLISAKASVTSFDSLRTWGDTASAGWVASASNVNGILTSDLYTYAQAGSLLTYINLNPHSLKLSSSAIYIDGATTFSSGYDPSTKTDSAKVTTIIGDIVTTGYVNALGITADSVASTYLYSKTIIASQISNGGTFSVSPAGIMIASSGSVGGWNMNSTDLYSGSIYLRSSATPANNKIFIGAATYNDATTPFYVDGSGQFSLGDKLTFNGTTLTINGNGTFSGALSAATGTFSGSLSAATGTFAGNLSAATGTLGSVTVPGTSNITFTGGGRVSFSGAGDVFANASHIVEISTDLQVDGTIGGSVISASSGFQIGSSALALSDLAGNIGGTQFTGSNATGYLYNDGSGTLSWGTPSGGGSGTVTSVATSLPITGGTITGSGTIGITQANTSTDGYLSSTDWNTFNGKASTSGTYSSMSVGYATSAGSAPASDVYSWAKAATKPSYTASDVGAVPTSRTVNGHALSADVTVSKSDVGLGSVENTALSTWAGTSNITTVGTISSGTWHGAAIADTYISSASTWNAKANTTGTYSGMSVGYASTAGSASTASDATNATNWTGSGGGTSASPKVTWAQNANNAGVSDAIHDSYGAGLFAADDFGSSLTTSGNNILLKDVTSGTKSTITAPYATTAGSVTNGVYTTGSYSNPSWITGIDGSKITGTGSIGSTILPTSGVSAGTYSFYSGGVPGKVLSMSIDSRGRVTSVTVEP